MRWTAVRIRVETTAKVGERVRIVGKVTETNLSPFAAAGADRPVVSNTSEAG